MESHILKTFAAVAIAFVCLANVARSQAPPPAPLAVPNPTYVSIPMEIMVNRPAAEVWKRVGKYCDIGEWLQVPCTITSGKDGEVGTIRSIGRRDSRREDGTFLHLHAARDGGPAVQSLPRHARGEAGNGDHVEAGLHADVR